MYNSGNSSKNVTGASIVDGTVETVDIADDAVTADKLANTVNTDIATGVSGSTTAGDALPKAGGTMTGTIAGFTSTGIDDNATSTAITIDASENVICAGNISSNVGGSASAPRIYLSNTANTGIYTPVTNGWGVTTNGVSALVIDASQNVGIGTNAPANVFHVKKDVDDFVCKIENDGNSTSSDGLWIDTRWNSATNTMLKVTTNSGGTEIMRVTVDGLTFNGDTAAANALDDYEEGTWSGNVVTGTATVANETYTKIGRSVTVTGNIYSFSDITTDIDIIVTGLPYVVNSSSLGAIGGRGIPLGKGYAAIGTNGQSQFKIMEQSNTTAYTFMKHPALIYASSSSTKMYFSFTYESN